VSLGWGTFTVLFCPLALPPIETLGCGIQCERLFLEGSRVLFNSGDNNVHPRDFYCSPLYFAEIIGP
jgi:hypothetical protein